MIYQALLSAIVIRQIGEIHREGHARRKILEIAGQAGVDGIPPHADDSRVRKNGVYDAHQIGVGGGLVDDAQRVRTAALDETQIILSELSPGGQAEYCLPYRHRGARGRP